MTSTKILKLWRSETRKSTSANKIPNKAKKFNLILKKNKDIQNYRNHFDQKKPGLPNFFFFFLKNFFFYFKKTESKAQNSVKNFSWKAKSVPGKIGISQGGFIQEHLQENHRNLGFRWSVNFHLITVFRSSTARIEERERERERMAFGFWIFYGDLRLKMALAKNNGNGILKKF